MILAGVGREVPGAPGGHLLIDLPALPDRLLRGVVQALSFSRRRKMYRAAYPWSRKSPPATRAAAETDRPTVIRPTFYTGGPGRAMVSTAAERP